MPMTPLTPLHRDSLAQKLALIAALGCLSLVLNFFERLLPIVLPIPGAKLGLANMVVLTALYILPAKEALGVVFLKSLLASLIFASLSAFLYSVAGSLLSFVVMLLMIRLGGDRFSEAGVSLTGGVFHNIGQLLIAAVIIQTPAIFTYLPALILTGAGTGLLTGMTVRLLLKHLRAAGVR